MKTVRVVISGIAGTYDGEVWAADDARLVRLLRATDELLPPRYHPTLASRVGAVLAEIGAGEITQADEPDDLPGDAIP